MRQKTVQKSFRFTEETNKKLSELVTMFVLETSHYHEVPEELLAIVNQTYVITHLINRTHLELLKDLTNLGYDLSEYGIEPLPDDDFPF